MKRWTIKDMSAVAPDTYFVYGPGGGPGGLIGGVRDFGFGTHQAWAGGCCMPMAYAPRHPSIRAAIRHMQRHVARLRNSR